MERRKPLPGFGWLMNRLLEIELVKPYRNLTYKLATPFLFVIPKEAVESYGESFGRNPVGTARSVGPGHSREINPAYSESTLLGAGNKRDGFRTSTELIIILASPEVAWSQFKLGALDLIEIPANLSLKSIAPNGKLLPEYARFVLLETDALTYIISASVWISRYSRTTSHYERR